MHRLIYTWTKEQWLVLPLLGILLVFMNLLLSLAWHLLGGATGILASLLQDGIEMLRVFGGQGVGPDNLVASYLAVGWRHPIIVALMAGYAASRGSKAVAREIEEGRAEFLYSLPYPRFAILLVHFITTALGMAALTAVLVYSAIFFSRTFGPEIEASRYVATGTLTFSLYMVVASVAYFFSSLLRQGGWAQNLTLIILLALYGADFGANLGLWENSRYTLFLDYKVAEVLGGLSHPGPETMGFLGLTGLFLAASLLVTTFKNV